MQSDSSKYYESVLRQDDYIDIASSALLPGDSIAYAVNKTTAGLYFNDYLLINYNKKAPPFAYTQQFPRNGSAMQSQITLINNREVEVQANGSYYYPADVLNLGFWSWWEKIATMLPYDYDPEEKD